ncbi:hypothetical protein FO519_007356, partial [Halicephalobus sp. NKZ332]
YNNLERPVENNSLPTVVYLKVSLQQLIDVDEKNQILHVNAWLDYNWNDYQLRWDPEEYGNITNIRFPTGQIWKPDVLLYNSVDSNFDSTYPTNMIAYNTGDVSWIPPGIFKISCKVDITYFPFDRQICFFKFGSWTYDGHKLDLQPAKGGFDTSEYLQNGEWILSMTTVSRSEKFYDCCPEPYPDLTFYIHLQRRTLYYGFNLITPCILATTISLLTFTLPPEAGEKITLQITVLLSICFFLGILAEMSPPTSEAVPLLGIFFICCMIVVTASTIFTVYVLNLHYRTPETHEMTKMTKIILLYWLPYILRIRRPGVNLTWSRLPSLLPRSKSNYENEAFIKSAKEVEKGCRKTSCEIERKFHNLINGSSKDDFLPFGSDSTVISTTGSKFTQFELTSQATILLLQKIYNELKVVTRKIIENEELDSAANQWKFAAMVVDRFCLYLFSCFVITTTIAIMVSAPMIRFLPRFTFRLAIRKKFILMIKKKDARKQTCPHHTNLPQKLRIRVFKMFPVNFLYNLSKISKENFKKIMTSRRLPIVKMSHNVLDTNSQRYEPCVDIGNLPTGFIPSVNFAPEKRELERENEILQKSKKLCLNEVGEAPKNYSTLKLILSENNYDEILEFICQATHLKRLEVWFRFWRENLFRKFLSALGKVVDSHSGSCPDGVGIQEVYLHVGENGCQIYRFMRNSIHDWVEKKEPKKIRISLDVEDTGNFTKSIVFEP